MGPTARLGVTSANVPMPERRPPGRGVVLGSGIAFRLETKRSEFHAQLVPLKKSGEKKIQHF